jgi:hypothetical protein
MDNLVAHERIIILSNVIAVQAQVCCLFSKYLVRPLGFIALKDFQIIWLSSLLALGVYDVFM